MTVNTVSVNTVSRNNNEQWFVIDLADKTFEGPLTLDGLKETLENGQKVWSDLAICPSRSFTWRRLFEIQELAALFPALPDLEILKHYGSVAFKQQTYVKSKLESLAQLALAQSKDSPAEWSLLIDENEFGPFTLQEIEVAFKQGKRPDRAYAWRSPMESWERIGAIQELSFLGIKTYGADFADDEDAERSSQIERGHNMRRLTRKRFAASIWRVSDSGVKQRIGVCKDLTSEGFHLQQDSFQVEYPLLSLHTLEIRPVKASKLPAVRLNAEVRWVDPISHGIGFMFQEVRSVDQSILELYLSHGKTKKQH